MAQCLPIRGLEIPWGENTLNDNLKKYKKMHVTNLAVGGQDGEISTV